MSQDAKEALKDRLLQTLNESGSVESFPFVNNDVNVHADLIGVMKSLLAQECVASDVHDIISFPLTAEGESFLANGSVEARFYAAVDPVNGTPRADLQAALGDQVAGLGMAGAMRNKWVSAGKDGIVHRVAPEIVDQVVLDLKAITAATAGGATPDAATKKLIDALKKRKLVSQTVFKVYTITKGPKFTLEKKELLRDLDTDALRSGKWQDTPFKPYNFEAEGEPAPVGAQHPLGKVRAEFRKVLTSMGFQEMPTNTFVESSFWNFDSLFQPQQHPARDAHDTFFLETPATSNTETVADPAYFARVKEMHESGGAGSIGYRYDWKAEEASKNILRTHTTASTSKMIYKVAEEYRRTGVFTPARYFSIDRVFRNETLDATHLAEFQQVEGCIIDRDLTLGHLIGTFKEFFARIGITDVTFKPAYNPYTEPSMEIFRRIPALDNALVEIGNSGVFRPEMLAPMGLPEDVRVLAWGLSLERPTMIKFNFDNIRDMVGPKMQLKVIKSSPIVRYDV